jgi:UDP-2-acetamido-3-amino-2,3-dideoxy-glucuronate N-acetyltransferase
MSVREDVQLGEGVVIPQPELVNVFGCAIGSGSMIGPFVEIQAGVVIGQRCRVQSHSFLCTGVFLEDDVFIGHGVMFTNDRYPKASNDDGSRVGPADWVLENIKVGSRTSIGSGSVILPGITIGSNVIIGAGSVVTKSIADNMKVAGNPARTMK